VSVDSDGRPVKISSDNLLDFCCNLIVLDDEFESQEPGGSDGQRRRCRSDKDNENAVFRFIHVSVREYFEKPRQTKYQASCNHVVALERCLWLYQPARDSEGNPQVLLNYATQFWPIHLRFLSNQPLETEIKDQIKSFFQRGRYISPSFEMWASDARRLSSSLPAPFYYMLRNVVSKPLTPLLLGCCFGILPIIHEIGIFDKMDTNWNQVSEKGHAGLCLAARFGYTATVEVLLNNGANPDIQLRHEDSTPLLWATFNGHEKVMHILLDNKVNVNATDRHSRTPLHFMARHGHVATSRILLDMGADADPQDKNGITPLSWAAGNGHDTTVKILLDKKADANAKDNNGKTPLSWAAGNGHDTIVEILLDKKADANAKDNNGKTPLSWAAGNGHDTIVEMLLSRGADADPRDKDGITPLSWAADKGHATIVQALLARRADPNSTDTTHGQTALSRAAFRGHVEIVNMLLHGGANAGLKDYRGRTPLKLAEGNRQMTVASILREHTAAVSSTVRKRRSLQWRIGA
jgi:ankyrin repeat protein